MSCGCSHTATSGSGTTGARSELPPDLADFVQRVRRHTDLPLAVGFGIRTPVRAAEIARVADAAVVGTAIVDRIPAGIGADGRPQPGLVDEVLGFVRSLADGVAGTRGPAS